MSGSRTPTEIVRAYKAGALTRAEMIEALATFPYKEPSYVERERGKSDAEKWFLIEDRDVFEDGTAGEVESLFSRGELTLDDMGDISDRILILTNDYRAPKAARP